MSWPHDFPLVIILLYQCCYNYLSSDFNPVANIPISTHCFESFQSDRALYFYVHYGATSTKRDGYFCRLICLLSWWFTKSDAGCYPRTDKQITPEADKLLLRGKETPWVAQNIDMIIKFNLRLCLNSLIHKSLSLGGFHLSSQPRCLTCHGQNSLQRVSFPLPRPSSYRVIVETLISRTQLKGQRRHL